MEQLKFGQRNSSTPSGRSASRGAKVCGIMGVSCCGQLRIFGSHKISDSIRENCSILDTGPLRLRPAKHRPLPLDLSLWSAVSRASRAKENAPECDSGALAKMKLRNNRCVTAAVASRQAAWSTSVLVSQPESCRQVRQPSLDTPDRRVSRCLG